MRNNRNRRKGETGGSAGSESGMYYSLLSWDWLPGVCFIGGDANGCL